MKEKVFYPHRNFAVAYVLLVALPIAGLVGILKSGRIVKAPTSVDGVWTIHAVAPQGTMSPCVSALGFDRDTPVTISQSGRNLIVKAEKIEGAALIEDTALQGSLRTTGSPIPSANCGGDDSVVLTATVEARTSPQVISGTLSVAGCPSCQAVEFHAVKQALTQGKGAP